MANRVGAESKRERKGKKGVIFNFREGRPPSTKDRCMIKALTSSPGEMCALQWTQFGQRQILGRVPGHVEPSSDSCYFQWYLSTSLICVWFGRECFASFWCLLTQIGINIYISCRSSKVWVLHRVLLVFTACSAILPFLAFAPSWLEQVREKLRSSFTGTQYLLRGVTSWKEEYPAAKHPAQNAFQHL